MVGRIMAFQRCPHPDPWNPWIYYITWQKRLWKCREAFRLWDGDVFLDYPNGPILTYGHYFKREPFHISSQRKCQWDVIKQKAGETENLRGIWPAFANFEDGRKELWAREPSGQQRMVHN